MIELRTLGGLELSSAGSNAAASVLTQPRRAALLCYLALGLPRGFHRRDSLYALFWPECDTDQARHALRQSLYFLRRALCPETIVSRGDDELALAPDQVSCDVWAFEDAVGTESGSCSRSGGTSESRGSSAERALGLREEVRGPRSRGGDPQVTAPRAARGAVPQLASIGAVASV